MKRAVINLQEDNREILDLIKYIDKKIVELRTTQSLSQPVIKDLKDLYEGAVNAWMEYNYLPGIEPDLKEEEEIRNNLLEIISFLNTIY